MIVTSRETFLGTRTLIQTMGDEMRWAVTEQKRKRLYGSSMFVAFTLQRDKPTTASLPESWQML